MEKKIGETFALMHALSGKALNASLCLAQEGVKPSGSKWIVRLANAGLKSCPMLAVLALGIASSAVGTAAAQRAAAQNAQTKPSAGQEESPDNRQPNGGELEIWRKTILKTPRPNNGEGCYTATYPETEWREVPCKTPSHKFYAPNHSGTPGTDTVGGGGSKSDFSAEVTGHISEAEGSFDIVTLDSSSEPNDYSLQLNTEPFDTKTCKNSPNRKSCRGWEQFVYSATDSGFIQYWLLNYDPKGLTCPKPVSPNCNGEGSYSDGWCQVSARPGDCVIDATNGAPVPSEPITNLQYLKVTADVAGVNGATNDSVAVTDGNTVWSASGDNHFPDLGSEWQVAEFNIFGDGGGSLAVFNPGSTVVVRTSVDSGKPSARTGPTSAPTCDSTGFTAEKNNLNLVRMGLTVAEGPLPSVVFTESNPGSSPADDEPTSRCLPLASLPIGTIYRWFNPDSSDHFYTQDPTGESAPTDGYIYEGARFELFPAGTIDTVPFTRWYNPATRHHFYTADPTVEPAPSLGFHREGNIGNIAPFPLPGTVPLFRWYNSARGDHFYTTDPTGELAPTTGYVLEKVAGFVEPVASLPPGAIYRWFSPNVSDHFYTQDPDGEDASTSGYVEDGLRFVLFPTGAKGTVPFTRWFNPKTGHHFYTAYPTVEPAPSLGFHPEGNIGNIAPFPLPGTVPLFRWYNPTSADHFYTTDPKGELAPTAGYILEEVAGFVKLGED